MKEAHSLVVHVGFICYGSGSWYGCGRWQWAVVVVDAGVIPRGAGWWWCCLCHLLRWGRWRWSRSWGRQPVLVEASQCLRDTRNDWSMDGCKYRWMNGWIYGWKDRRGEDVKPSQHCQQMWCVMSVCLICLTACLCFLSVYLHICISAYLHVCLSVCLSNLTPAYLLPTFQRSDFQLQLLDPSLQRCIVLLFGSQQLLQLLATDLRVGLGLDGALGLLVALGLAGLYANDNNRGTGVGVGVRVGSVMSSCQGSVV